MKIGYTEPLFILPFDHRSTMSRDFLGVQGELNPEQKEKIRELKTIVYNGLLSAVTAGAVPKDGAAVLVDGEYGEEIIQDAKERKLVTLLTMEKSGGTEFEFDAGDDFEKRLIDLQPDFAKALIRYNPSDDIDKNERQREKLKKLADVCHSHKIKFLLEPIISPTASEANTTGGDKELFDTLIRPAHMVKLIQEFQTDVIDVDVWKIEGLEKRDSYVNIITHARISTPEIDRSGVGLVVLGRGESKDKVDKWIQTARGVQGVIGFAVGRTIFSEPLKAFAEGKLSADEAVQAIADGYAHFYKVFAGTV